MGSFIKAKPAHNRLGRPVQLLCHRLKLDQCIDAALVIESRNCALGNRVVERELLLIHTNQSSQYRATDYPILLEKYEISSSMFAKGCCLDNAVAESFYSTLKLGIQVNGKSNRRKPARCLGRSITGLFVAATGRQSPTNVS